MSKNHPLCIIIITLFSFLPLSARSALVYQSAPQFNTGSSTASFETLQHAAGRFVFSSSETIKGVSWYGRYGLLTTADVNIRFYNNVFGGKPADLGNEFYAETITVTGVNTGQTDNIGLPVYEYYADLSSGVNFSPNTYYWVSITHSNSSSSWLSGTSLARDFAWWDVINSATTWQTQNGSVAFSLYAVPVPPAVWFFGSGLLGLAGIARRKKTT